MRNPAFLISFFILSLVFVSCSSARYQQGFSYQPAYSGPDIASGQEEEKMTITAENNDRVTVVENIATPNPAISDNNTETLVLAGIISREYDANQENKQTVNTRETIHKIAADYAATQNKQLTTKQLRKLDRFAAKMEKKQQKAPSDVSWGPANNLEWFVLLGAGVGLIVGILGVGFGWFVFLGLALVYLFLKLLKNN